MFSKDAAWGNANIRAPSRPLIEKLGPMPASNRTQLMFFLVVLFLPGTVMGDVVVLNSGDRITGTVANRELLANNPQRYDHVAILVEGSDEFKSFSVSDVLYVLLIDGEQRRVVDFQTPAVSAAPAGTDTSDALAKPVTSVGDRGIVYIGIGLGRPVSPTVLKDGWSPGISIGLRAGTWLSKNVAITVGVDFNRFGLDVDALTAGATGVSVDGGATSILYISGSLEFGPSVEEEWPLRIYFLVGGGFFRAAVGDVTMSSSQESVTIFGGEEGAVGVNLGTRIVVGRVYGEVSYLLGFTDIESTALLSFRAGIAFGTKIGKQR